MLDKTMVLLCMTAILGMLVGCASGEQPEQKLPHRWLFVMRNLRNPANVERTIELLPRAAAAGYNALVLSDSSLYDLDSAGASYAKNVRRVQEEARRHGLELIPCVMPIGYSGSILGADPNLAEGLPVKGALFVASDGIARLSADPAVSLPGGDFERIEGGRFAGWDWYDNPGKSIFPDRQVVHGGRTAARMERISEADPVHGHCRFMRRVQVAPFRQYHLSAWVKTQDFEAPESVRVSVLAPTEKERAVASIALEVKKTQDWAQYHLVFNSLSWEEVQIYLGTWGGKGGRIWWDDVRLEEIGLMNVLRREGCPLSVSTEDGVEYQEGRDFEPIRDPQLRPWQIYHEPPVIRLSANSRISDGQRLRVSYYHPIVINRWQVMCCLSEEKVYDVLREQVRRVNDLLHPNTFFMQHDEIRVANWDQACRSRGLTPGELLADNVRRCVAIIRDLRPDAAIWVWSDMFDPMHNAVDEYYLVNGTWAGSWEGLPADVGIVNWANHLKGKNLGWFANRGHAQVLAGYYDHEEWIIEEWLEAGDGLPGVAGAMYTTWRDNYHDMEAWAARAWGAKVD
ncbi:MAG: hypothetical protein JSV79_11530 [Armatimonadota bacterium]|nr:MAG: hypothetical protein JSV79_11530 [Armatimonadota bacterium]